MGSEALWERMKVLIVNEASCLASVVEFYKGISLVFRFPYSEETSIEHVIAFERSHALVHEVLKIQKKISEKMATQMRDAVRYS